MEGKSIFCNILQRNIHIKKYFITKIIKLLYLTDKPIHMSIYYITKMELKCISTYIAHLDITKQIA